MTRKIRRHPGIATAIAITLVMAGWTLKKFIEFQQVNQEYGGKFEQQAMDKWSRANDAVGFSCIALFGWCAFAALITAVWAVYQAGTANGDPVDPGPKAPMEATPRGEETRAA